MNILGIETSCDETAVGIVNDRHEILADIVLSQLDEHRVFGGVVPEIAARAHMDHIDGLIKAAMIDAGLEFGDIDAVAATCGPGLIGGVMVGMMAGKSIAAAFNKPFIAVNHLEAHILTARLVEDDLDFPFLVLLVSGGHTQILVAEDVGLYKLWGTTIDDAMGECFDKSAKLMGLPYPGGPELEKAATECIDAEKAIARFPLPVPLKGRAGCDFSFSGLKTAVRTHVDKLPKGALQMTDVADLSCAFQHSICEIVKNRCTHALKKFQKEHGTLSAKPAVMVVAGGVAANKTVRSALQSLTNEYGMRFIAPPVKLCSDNGVMIAWAGLERFSRGMTDNLDHAALPRWPLDKSKETIA